MTDLSKATPLPWGISENPGDQSWKIIGEQTGRIVADVWGRLEDQPEANAALIVKAVNERDELIAALREAETVMMIVQPRSHMKDYLAALETVRAALTKADGP
jgi:hypothetical protein